MRLTHELDVGDRAPDFCLTVTESTNGSQQKKSVCLHDFRGQKPIILEFFMAAFTPL